MNPIKTFKTYIVYGYSLCPHSKLLSLILSLKHSLLYQGKNKGWGRYLAQRRGSKRILEVIHCEESCELHTSPNSMRLIN